MSKVVIETITSKSEEQAYPFPDGMKRVLSVHVGDRSLGYAPSTINGVKSIVLLEPLGMDDIEIEVKGVK